MHNQNVTASNEVYDANWGHIIMWLCLLLLTTCVIASGDEVPASRADFNGTFTDGRLTLVLTPQADQVAGVAKLGSKEFPLKATIKDNQIEGSFVNDGNSFAFNATIDHDHLSFTTGQTHYELNRQHVENPLADAPAAVPNPLAPPEAAPAAAAPSVGAIPAAAAPPVEASPAKPSPKVALDRPMLQVQQGQYFRWSMPKDWHSNETTNGVDISSPDNSAGASSALLVGAPGQSSPRRFVEVFLPQCGLQNMKILASKDLPDQNYAGMPMKITQMEMTYNLNGGAFHGLCTCAIVNGWGQYTAFLQSAGSAPEQWDKVKTWLPAVAESVTITNPRQVALQDRITLPKNRPLDDSSIMSSWEERNKSQDRISQKWEETTLGYERMKDTSTGQMYDMPFENYDATRGGYVNPQRPTEILEHAEPGE